MKNRGRERYCEAWMSGQPLPLLWMLMGSEVVGNNADVQVCGNILVNLHKKGIPGFLGVDTTSSIVDLVPVLINDHGFTDNDWKSTTVSV
jgi:hypothetical protein